MVVDTFLHLQLPKALALALPHTPQPEAEYGSGYGLDPAAGHGASGVSARFPHTQTPSSGRKKRKHQASQLETGEGPTKTQNSESVDGTLKFSQVSPVVSLLGAHLSDNFPWLSYVPDRLRHRLTPTLAPGDFAPGPVLDDPLSLDSCIHAHYPRLSPHIVAFVLLCGRQSCFSHGNIRWVTTSSTVWASWWPRLLLFPRTWIFAVGMDLNATIQAMYYQRT